MKPHSATAASRRHIVKAAEALLRARLPDPVAIRHLCGVTGVCERTLRNAFYDVLGMSPKQFMLRARLDEVHEALKRREKQVTVTAIATKYGFYELGRFAGRYKVVFGEYPSDTLRAGDDKAESRVTLSGRKTMAA